MRKRGMTQEAFLAALLEENRQRCDPPLDEKEVERIAKSVSKYKPAETSERYLIDEGHICAMHFKRGDPVVVPLCNFDARITEEVTLDDGVEKTRAFVIEGSLDTRKELPTTRVSAARFAGLKWVPEDWGAEAIVNAGLSTHDQVREAIQRFSPTPTSRIIFTHTGWREVNGKKVFLTSHGAIGGESVEVELSTDLQRYQLPLRTRRSV
jgi:primase-like protein